MDTDVRTSNFTLSFVFLYVRCQMSAMAKQYWCLDYTGDFSHTTAFPFLKASTVKLKGHLHTCIGKT